jgi:hypothetical protein
MHRLRLLIIVIGVLLSGLAYAQDEISIDGASVHPGMVIVEPDNIVKTAVDGNYALVPYLERRPRWGTTFSVEYSTYEPVHYEPDFAPTMDFSDVYLSPDLPEIEAQLTVKRNLSWGSLGGELAAGVYQNSSDIDTSIADSSLSLIPVRLGAVFALDALMKEPYFVPYISGGGYIMVYTETSGSSTHHGSTQVAPYLNGGVEFGLNWLDRNSARDAYEDTGMESTYLFVEARKMFKSMDPSDPDFSNDVSFASGLRLEF